MAKKYKEIRISEKLHTDISQYCNINSLSFNEIVEKLLREGINKMKWGDKPFSVNDEEQKKENITIDNKTIEVKAIPSEEKIEFEMKPENKENNNEVFKSVEDIKKEKTIKSTKRKLR